MQSQAKTVSQYLKELPEDRRGAIAKVREVILKNMDPDLHEQMQYGMIGYCVPHSIYPPGYHCDPKQPLPFAGLASQKNHMSLYLCSAYGDQAQVNWLQQQFAQAGKKLDMGKCCIRFKRLEDLPLDVVGKAFSRISVAEFIGQHEAFVNAVKAAKKAKVKAPKTTASKAIKSQSKSKTTVSSTAKRTQNKKVPTSSAIAGKVSPGAVTSQKKAASKKQAPKRKFTSKKS
jgi:Domain of unknown function (DU1801)